MMIGDRFFFETFYMNKFAVLIIVGITLASHAPGALLLQCIEITVNYFLCCLFPAFRNRKGHNIPYHSAYSFGFTAGNTNGIIAFKNAACMAGGILLFG